MNANKPDEQSSASHLPLPGRQFQHFVLLFHVAFLTGMILLLPVRWHRTGFAWNSTEVGLMLLVLLQVGCYIRFFAWPAPEAVQRERWAFYFPVSFALWFITWRIEPVFEWVVLGYAGQLFGAVPPKFSIPGAAAVFLMYLPAKLGWSGLLRLSVKEWLGYGAMIVVWSALGLFLHRLAVTSAERAKLIQELEKARLEVESARQHDTELAALRERERLARELHDSLGHGLVTLTIQLEAAQRLYGVDPVRASALMNQMKRLTRDTMDQLRRSLAGLRSPGLGERPLGAAVRELCAEMSARTGLRVDCALQENAARLTPAVAEVLWRVAQEGLANIEKHARASAARVTLEQESTASGPGHSAVLLKIVDDGLGLPQGAEARAGHYGLRGVRERVEGLGGVFTASSPAGKGTTLAARLPVHM